MTREEAEQLQALGANVAYQALMASVDKQRDSAKARALRKDTDDRERAIAAAEYRAFETVLTLRERTLAAYERTAETEEGE